MRHFRETITPDRRAFVPVSIFVFLVAFPFNAAAQERVHHAGAGISVTPPATWREATLAEVQSNRERVRLSDPELQHALATRSALPLFAFTKYPEPHRGLNPSIQITLRSSLAGPPTELLRAALQTMRRAFPDFQIVSAAQPIELAGWPAAHTRATYTLKAETGEAFRVMSRLWLVKRGPLMFLIGMSGSVSGEDTCEAEFAAALSSISILP
jgi:hypothetical protein